MSNKPVVNNYRVKVSVGIRVRSCVRVRHRNFTIGSCRGIIWLTAYQTDNRT